MSKGSKRTTLPKIKFTPGFVHQHWTHRIHDLERHSALAVSRSESGDVHESRDLGTSNEITFCLQSSDTFRGGGLESGDNVLECNLLCARINKIHTPKVVIVLNRFIKCETYAVDDDVRLELGNQFEYFVALLLIYNVATNGLSFNRAGRNYRKEVRTIFFLSSKIDLNNVISPVRSNTLT